MLLNKIKGLSAQTFSRIIGLMMSGLPKGVLREPEKSNDNAQMVFNNHVNLMRRLFSLALLLPACAVLSFAGTIDLSQAVVVVRPGPLANAEKAAAVVLIEEMQKRSGIRLPEST